MKRKEYNEKYIFFLLRREYGEIREVAKKIGVTDKMIYLYITEYFLKGKKLKFERKKGAYSSFKKLLKDAERNFERKVTKVSKEEEIDKELFLKVLKKTL